MIQDTILLHDARWRVELAFIESCDETYNVADILSEQGSRGTELIEAIQELSKCALNFGLTFSNGSRRTSVLVIGLQENHDELINTICHEMHHVVMHACKTDHIQPDTEEAANIAGELGEAMSETMKRYRIR